MLNSPRTLLLSFSGNAYNLNNTKYSKEYVKWIGFCAPERHKNMNPHNYTTYVKTYKKKFIYPYTNINICSYATLKVSVYKSGLY